MLCGHGWPTYVKEIKRLDQMKDILQAKTILYIEDEADLAKIVRDELVEYGSNVTQVDNVAEASKIIATTKFDLIIADFLLKDGTGDTLINEIKTGGLQMNKETPIIVTSAFIGQELIDEFEGKISSFLTKPHTMARLLDKIQEALS
jgi:DNA-binding NtrC family response regulator